MRAQKLQMTSLNFARQARFGPGRPIGQIMESTCFQSESCAAQIQSPRSQPAAEQFRVRFEVPPGSLALQRDAGG